MLVVWQENPQTTPQVDPWHVWQENPQTTPQIDPWHVWQENPQTAPQIDPWHVWQFSHPDLSKQDQHITAKKHKT